VILGIDKTGQNITQINGRERHHLNILHI
jgi:hypothetical protein